MHHFIFSPKAEMLHQENPKFLNQVQYCEKQEIPLMLIIGEEEIEKKQVKVRNVKEKTEVIADQSILTLSYSLKV